MSRYTTTPIIKRWDGKRVYKTTHYPSILPQPNDIQITSNETDYLDTLAHKYYGDASLYWIIALANNLGKGRLSVPSGLTLRIPMNVSEIVNQFNRLNDI